LYLSGGLCLQKNHQNQQKHAKDPPKSAETYKRTFLLILVVLLYVFVDFGGSFVCFS
jgi:hypothetical protein